MYDDLLCICCFLEGNREEEKEVVRDLINEKGFCVRECYLLVCVN